MHYVGFQYNDPIQVERYCFLIRGNSIFTRWKLQGSNNGIIWYDVDTRDEAEYIGWKCVEIVNQLSFTYWRLVFFRWSRFSTPGIAEVKFYTRP